jgi:hypothetical protein
MRDMRRRMGKRRGGSDGVIRNRDLARGGMLGGIMAKDNFARLTLSNGIYIFTRDAFPVSDKPYSSRC